MAARGASRCQRASSNQARPPRQARARAARRLQRSGTGGAPGAGAAPEKGGRRQGARRRWLAVGASQRVAWGDGHSSLGRRLLRG